MGKYIDIDKLITEIERLKKQLISGACAAQINMETACKEEAYNEVLSYINYLQKEQKCIFGNIPNEDICSVCSAYCSLRVPKIKVSTSAEIAASNGQAEDLTFEDYLRGCFEINNGIENDPDNLVRIHAPELLKLARKENIK